MTVPRPATAARRKHRATEARPTQVVTPRPRWRIAGLLVVLLLLVAVFFFAGGATRLCNHFAEEAIADRELVTARSWLDFSERLSPRNPHRYFLAARIARREGDLQGMAENLERALRNGFDPERVRREHILGQAQIGRLEGIETEINQWLMDGDHETPEISSAYANGLASQSRLGAALRVLEAWHLDYPEDPVPLYRAGRIHEYFDEIDEAKQHYQAAIELDENYLPPHYSLGRLLLDEKQPQEAMAHFQRCLAAPDPAAAEVGVARCLIEMGETERATELLYDVMQRDADAILASYRGFGETPERFLAAAELGKLEANSGNYAEAKRLLDLALAENPRDLAARYSRAVALRGLGQQSEAEAEFAEVQEVQKELAKVNALRNRIGRSPEDTEARLTLGNLLLQYESERNGLFWIRSVLAYDPDNAQAHEALADYYESHASESPRNSQLAHEHRSRASVPKAE